MIKTDTQAREDIINRLDENFFVDAGAGSGKTTSVALRMVQIAKKKDLDASKQICAITFTKAAADEFYSRYQKYLLEELSICEDETLKNKLENAYKNIDTCFMGTIDAFCKKIIEEHPKEAQIPNNATIATESQIDDVFNLYFDFDASNEDPVFEEFKKYCIGDPRTFMKIIVNDLINKREYDVHFESIDETFNEYLGQSQKDVIDLMANIQFNHAVTDKSLDDYNDLNLKLLDADWSEKFTNAYYLVKGIGKLVLTPGIISSPFVDEKGKIDLSSITNKFLEYSFSKAMNYAMQARDGIIEHLREKGYFTFFDYLYYLRNMLRKDLEDKGGIVQEIQKEYKYFFLDEFQDTDPLQAEIFFYLASSNHKPVWYENIPNKGSLFIVGDPKQSIYSFKGADIKSYNNVEKLFENPQYGEVLKLTNNFRSNNTLKKYFNDLFMKAVDVSNPYKLENFYEEIPVDLDDDYDSFSGAFKYSLSKGVESLPNLILGLVNSGRDIRYKYKKDLPYCDKCKKHYEEGQTVCECGAKLRLKDIDFVDHRPITFDDIMIITNNKESQILSISENLSDYNIPHFTYGNVPFSKSEFLVLIYDICDYVLNNTKTTFYKLLTNPIFNLSETEKVAALYNKPIENKLFNNVLNVVNELIDQKDNYNCLSLIINNLINNKDIIEVIPSDYNALLYQVYEILLQQEAASQINSLKDGLNILEVMLSNRPIIEKSLLFDDSHSGVMIANLHKVKGLERPIVITYNTKDSSKAEGSYSSRNPNVYNPICYEYRDDKAIPHTLKGKVEQSIVDKAEAEKADEIDRQNYVAATRAQEIFIVTYKKGSKAKNHFLDLINEDVKDIDEYLGEVKPIYKDLTHREECKDIVIENTNKYSFTQPSHSKVQSHGDVEPENKNTDILTLGTMVHKLMEVLVLSKANCNLDSLCEQISIDYTDTIDYKFKLMDIGKTMINGGYEQEAPVAKDILKVILDADEVFTEVPFSYQDNNKIYHGIMDVVYVKDDVYHIIDYKTDTRKTNLDIIHKDQLDIYKKALLLQGVNNVDAHIYRIDKGDN